MKDKIPPLQVEEFNYALPDDRIARHPVHPRHNSKLLVWNGHKCEDFQFCDLPAFIDKQTLMVFNDTRVIPARLVFQLPPSDARIEVFLLQPADPGWKIWECQIGNRKKFKEDIVLRRTLQVKGEDWTLEVHWNDRASNKVTLFCAQNSDMHAVLDAFGTVPLPPYLHRAADAEDKMDYQTIFARNEGAVAAPTASLHFTELVMQALKKKEVKTSYITLHVGMGTFKPVTATTANAHDMHAERFVVTESFLKTLKSHLGSKIIASGTTSLRVLESLFYIGAASLLNIKNPQIVARDVGFLEEFNGISLQAAVDELLRLAANNGGEIRGETSIFILPGFEFRICTGLITNFHQPGSTLLMLVAAFTGGKWKEIYGHAMSHGYRFLSYGDGSLLFREK
ncbi:MAG: S-adenosylmethionine:tRNA ribosyltransferase-isomerase [Bacteroidetes bacterium]|nr:S-adenosylmethionine:tRNA ribosyltransferase-isomerase [Bacteroidota bacterium]